jgi:salicylate hydroxylase
MTDAAEIAERNARMRVNRAPETATFPPEQERLYGYDAEAVLRNYPAEPQKPIQTDQEQLN